MPELPLRSRPFSSCELKESPALRTYCVGDVHGMAGLLRQALAFIAVDAKDQPARVIFLGDYVDRGPDPKGVLDLLMAGPTNPRHVWVALKGNHDQLMADALAGDELALINWLQNGGLTTLGSFGLSLYDWDRVPEPYRAFLASLPLWAEDEQRIYVHAGLRPGVALERQDPQDLLWIREPFLGADHAFGRLVVHGHTPVTRVDYRPPYRLNLDTGAVFRGGNLTVAVWDEGCTEPRFWQTRAVR